MGPEPAKEKKSKDGKKEQESEPPHLYKTELNTLAVANRRDEFLNAAMKIPEARAKLNLLFDETTGKLAVRDFGRRQLNEPSDELAKRIEQWAIDCHLAKAPAKDWWIFPTAVSALKNRFIPDEDDLEAEGPWPCLFNISPIKDCVPFTMLMPWDPSLESKDEFLEGVLAQLAEYMASIEARYERHGFAKSKKHREATHYEWLVRNQILGDGLLDIASRPLLANGETVRITLNRLRKALQLPSLAPPGRPRKSK